MDNHKLSRFLIFYIGACLTGVSVGFDPKPVLKGGNVELTCDIDLNKKDQFVTWGSSRYGVIAVGNHIVQSSLNNRYSINHPSSLETNLFIRNVRETDEANFTCKIGSEVVRRWQLVIETKPQFLEQDSSPHTVDVTEGSDVTLWCNVTGVPMPTVTWLRQRSDNVHSPRRDLGITGTWLLLRNISRYASDTYICKATNKYESVYWDILVTVQFPPVVHVMEAEVEHAVNSDLSLSCMTQGHPLYEVYWTGTFGRVVTSWRYDVVTTTDDYYHMTVVSIIFRNGWNVYGEYTCIARGLQTVSKSVRIIEPTTPSTTTSSGIIRYDPGTK